MKERKPKTKTQVDVEGNLVFWVDDEVVGQVDLKQSGFGWLGEDLDMSEWTPAMFERVLRQAADVQRRGEEFVRESMKDR